MQTRRDQVDAHLHMMTRLAGAMVRSEPEGLESPHRRDLRGVVAAVLVGILALGGAAGWALLSQRGSTAWRQPRTLIIDKTSGSRYLMIGGVLRPVLNVASARLMAGGDLKTATVASDRISDLPRGAPVGIPGAPDMLPDAAKLNSGVPRVCSDDRGAVIQLGQSASPNPLAPGQALLVSARDRTYLLWQGRRMRLPHVWTADVLGLSGFPVLRADRSWLDLVPAGPDIELVVDERGAPGPRIAGHDTTIGQTVTADLPGRPAAHYLVLKTGLAPLDATRYALAVGELGSVAELDIASSALADIPRAELTPVTDLPSQLPRPVLAPSGQAPCLEYPATAPGTPRLVFAPVPGLSDLAPADTGSVQVAPGAGMLAVTTRPAPGTASAEAQDVVLVDGAGTAYPVAPQALGALGYSADQAVYLPPAVVALLPSGPSLGVEEGG